jgi:hypothetical protein
MLAEPYLVGFPSCSFMFVAVRGQELTTRRKELHVITNRGQHQND